MGSGSVDLEGVLAKFNERVSRLPVDLQSVFYEDLATAVENRIVILEKVRLSSS